MFAADYCSKLYGKDETLQLEKFYSKHTWKINKTYKRINNVKD